MLYTLLLPVLLAVYIVCPDRFVGTRARNDLTGPKGMPILGNLLEIFPWRHRTLQWIALMTRRYGPLFTFTMPPWGRGIFINRPEWVAHVKQKDMSHYSRGPVALSIFYEFPGKGVPVSTEGQEWKVARRIMQPIFGMRSFEQHTAAAMSQLVPTARELLKTLSTRNQSLDWNDLCGRLALAIFCQSVLGVQMSNLCSDSACLDEPDQVCEMLRILSSISSGRLLNPFWRYTDFLDGTYRRFQAARSTIWKLVNQVIDNRLLHPNVSTTRVDYLSHLILSQKVSDKLILRDIIVTLLFAGKDNTQNALAWSLYALIGAPEWIDRLRAEAGDVLSKGGTLAYTDMQKCHIHLAVFYETVRLWPGLPKNARVALHEDRLPPIPGIKTNPTTIYPGEYVFWSDYMIMRDSAVWGIDAERFNPGRHLDSDGRFVRPIAPNFIGFGGGPRICPAAQLSAFEFVACVIGIIPHFDFSLVDPSAKPEIVEAFTPTLGGGLHVFVQERK